MLHVDLTLLVVFYTPQFEGPKACAWFPLEMKCQPQPSIFTKPAPAHPQRKNDQEKNMEAPVSHLPSISKEFQYPKHLKGTNTHRIGVLGHPIASFRKPKTWGAGCPLLWGHTPRWVFLLRRFLLVVCALFRKGKATNTNPFCGGSKSPKGTQICFGGSQKRQAHKTILLCFSEATDTHAETCKRTIPRRKRLK